MVDFRGTNGPRTGFTRQNKKRGVGEEFTDSFANSLLSLACADREEGLISTLFFIPELLLL